MQNPDSCETAGPFSRATGPCQPPSLDPPPCGRAAPPGTARQRAGPERQGCQKGHGGRSAAPRSLGVFDGEKEMGQSPSGVALPSCHTPLVSGRPPARLLVHSGQVRISQHSWALSRSQVLP